MCVCAPAEAPFGSRELGGEDRWHPGICVIKVSAFGDLSSLM